MFELLQQLLMNFQCSPTSSIIVFYSIFGCGDRSLVAATHICPNICFSVPHCANCAIINFFLTSIVLNKTHAWAVDASSKLEISPGQKDYALITKYIDAAQRGKQI